MNPSSTSAAGHRPSQGGYGRRGSRNRTRPIARHGLNAANTLPNSTETGTKPTQNSTNTITGAMFELGFWLPAKPA